MFHSFGGGTGSGLGCDILHDLHDAFDKKPGSGRGGPGGPGMTTKTCQVVGHLAGSQI